MRRKIVPRDRDLGVGMSGLRRHRNVPRTLALARVLGKTVCGGPNVTSLFLVDYAIYENIRVDGTKYFCYSRV